MWSVMCLLAGFDVDSALELVGAGPAAGALLLVRADRARARYAADRAEADVVERVVRDLVDGDVGPDALLVPVREWVQLPDVVALRPLHLRGGRPARRLVAPDSRDPRAVGLERLEERLDPPDVAAAGPVGLPEVRALLPVLLRHRDQPPKRDQTGPPTLDPTASHLRTLA